MNSMNWLILLALAAMLLTAFALRSRKKRSRRAASDTAHTATSAASLQEVETAFPVQEQAETRSEEQAEQASGWAESFTESVPLAPVPQQELETADSATSTALLRGVFETRLHALIATYRLKLESIGTRPEDAQARDLLQKQVLILSERSAQLDASYQKELTCHEDVVRFLGRLASSTPDSRAGHIRQTLLHSASPREAEAFLEQFSQDPESRPSMAAQAAFLSGRLAEMRVDLPLALERYRKALHISPDNLEYLYRAGQVAQDLTQYHLAARWLENRLQLMEKQSSRSTVDLALAQRDLAYNYLKASRFDLAGPLYKTAMTSLSDTLGNNHPEMATGWCQLGEMQENQGAYDKAQTLYRRALDILESNLGRLDLHLAPVLGKLAALVMDMGLEKEALVHYQQLVAIQEKFLPSQHPQLAASLERLAKAYWLRGEYALAEQCYLKSLRINEALYEREHPSVAALLKELGKLCLQQGKTEEAERYQHEAEAIMALHLERTQKHARSDDNGELSLH